MVFLPAFRNTASASPGQVTPSDLVLLCNLYSNVAFPKKMNSSILILKYSKEVLGFCFFPFAFLLFISKSQPAAREVVATT